MSIREPGRHLAMLTCKPCYSHEGPARLMESGRTIATYQTLQKSERLKKFDAARFGLIIVDEAHHAASRS